MVHCNCTSFLSLPSVLLFLDAQRRSYIAYLDSVRFFEPASLRTTAYHELTLGYLSFAAQRGMSRAHIWACPPARSVTYIFWKRPPEQRTPSRDHLRSWSVRGCEGCWTAGAREHLVCGAR